MSENNSKKKVFLHVGYPKTGTTTLQKHYFPRLDNAQYINKYYGSQSFREYEKIFNQVIYGARDEINFPRLRTKLARLLGKDPIIISHENFILDCFLPKLIKGKKSYVLPVLIARNLRELFDEESYDVMVIITIRRQDKIIQSLYSQCYMCYYSELETLDTFEKFYNMIVSSSVHPIRTLLCYDYIISIYDKLFGSENVKVLLYEEFESCTTAFLDRLNNIINLKPIDSELLVENKRRASEGYSLAHDFTLRFLLIRIRNKLVPRLRIGLSKRQKMVLDFFVLKSNRALSKSIILSDSQKRNVMKAFYTSNGNLGKTRPELFSNNKYTS